MTRAQVVKTGGIQWPFPGTLLEQLERVSELLSFVADFAQDLGQIRIVWKSPASFNGKIVGLGHNDIVARTGLLCLGPFCF